MSKTTRSKAKRGKANIHKRQVVGNTCPSLDDFAELPTNEQEAWADDAVKTNDPEVLEPMLPKVLASFLRDFSTKALDCNMLNALGDQAAGRKAQELRLMHLKRSRQDKLITGVLELLGNKRGAIHKIHEEERVRRQRQLRRSAQTMRNGKRNAAEMVTIKTPVVTSKPLNHRRVKVPQLPTSVGTMNTDKAQTEAPPGLTMKGLKMQRKRAEKQRRKAIAVVIQPSQATIKEAPREDKLASKPGDEAPSAEEEDASHEASGEAEQSENLFPGDKPPARGAEKVHEQLEKPLSYLKLESDISKRQCRRAPVNQDFFPRLESREKLSRKRDMLEAEKITKDNDAELNVKKSKKSGHSQTKASTGAAGEISDQKKLEFKDAVPPKEEAPEPEPKPEPRAVDVKYKQEAGTGARVLTPSELDMYSEFLAHTPTRFSKTKIFTDYKEMHNKKNITMVSRPDKRYFKKQMIITNKEKGVHKKCPCWASDLVLVRKIQAVQEKLQGAGVMPKPLAGDQLKAYLKPKVDHLITMMTREYEANVQRIRKQREEQRRLDRLHKSPAGVQKHPPRPYGYGAENFNQKREYGQKMQQATIATAAKTIIPKGQRAAALLGDYKFSNASCAKKVKNTLSSVGI